MINIASRVTFLTLLVLVTTMLSPNGFSQQKPQNTQKAQKTQKIKATEVFSTDGVIWGFDFITPQEVVMTLREGKLIYYNFATKKQTLLAGPKVDAGGQGGLLDVLVHTVAGEKYIFLTYSEKVGATLTTSLAKAKFKDNKLSDLKRIFSAKVVEDSTRHFGSRVVIRDNHIFMTIGDRGERKYAQDLKLHNGKILRLTLDGNPAKGNPFENDKNALPEIWSYGHRNPQGIDFSPTDGNLFSCEFGPRGGDELNLVKPGKNYGWPVITYGKEYYGPSIGKPKKEGMEQPVVYWVPSISPSGMSFYTGDKIIDWQNNLFLANLGSTHLRRLVLKDGEVVSQEVLFEDLEERIRQVKNGPDGFLYFSTDSGKLLRVEKSENVKRKKG